MYWLATTILAFAPQGTVIRDKEGRIVLPPAPVRAPEQPQTTDSPNRQDAAATPQIRDGVQRRFVERAHELRRSRGLSRASEDELLRAIGADFPDAATRALTQSRGADDDLLHGLMRVLLIYGGPAEARELQYLLQTRPFGKATRVAVETMAEIARDESRELLFACLTTSRDEVRRFATDALASRVRSDDAARLFELARQGSDDTRARAIRLLGRIPTDEVGQYLLGALRDDPRIAEAACRALIDLGEPAVTHLQPLLRAPATGRAFGFASFALASLEESLGRELFTDDMREPLLGEVDMPDAFMRAAAAIGLAGMAWRSSDTTGELYADRSVVDALVAAVAPVEFVPHVALLQDVARRRLARFTGKDFQLEYSRWRDWWANIASIDGYVGARRRFDLTDATASLAVLAWDSPQRRVRIRGERTAAIPSSDEFVLDLLADPAEFAQLVARLERLGFMRDRPFERSPTPSAASLRLSVGGARCQTDPHAPAQMLANMATVIDEFVDGAAWQIYRDPVREPDVAAFWRAERRWLEANPVPAARAERLLDRIVGRIGNLRGPWLDLAITHLGTLPELRSIMDGKHAAGILAALQSRGTWDERSARLADLILAAGDAAPWRDLVATASELAGDESREVMSHLLSLLGPDRVLEVLDDQDGVHASNAVRVAAMDEVVSLQDQRGVPRLVELLHDTSGGIRATAVYSLGRLRSPEGRQPLLDLLVEQPDMAPELRRLVWVALARIGGDEVMPVLGAAFYSPAEEDRRAVLQAFAELRQPSAAREIANVFALRGPNDDLGLFALQALRGLGDLLGSPALKPHLDSPNASVRREAAFLLGEFGDPAALPSLIELVSDDAESLRAVALVASTIGINVTERNDRVVFLRDWYARRGGASQGQWLVDALGAHGLSHRLDAKGLVAAAGPNQVGELTRLLVEAEPAYLRPLVARVLRVTTQQDFGVVGVATDAARLRAIAERYRFLEDADKAASGR